MSPLLGVPTKEVVNVMADTGGSVDVFIKAGQVVYFTNPATSDFQINLKGNANTTFDSLLENGEAMSISIMITTGTTTAYTISSITIDGGSSTLINLPTFTPTTSTVNVYGITLIKTGGDYTSFVFQNTYGAVTR
jgi:hypothetical protein